jgi:hypothetical protein
MIIDVFGVDPGAQGGAVNIFQTDVDEPIIEAIPFAKATRYELIQWFCDRVQTSTPSVGFVEKVSASPQMGVVSAFTFGANNERAIMALVAAGIGFEFVQPKEWQRSVGLFYPKGSSHSEHKKLSRQRAQELFPDCGVRITNDIADALLIAEHGRRSVCIR